VVLTFRNLSAKVRMGIYETVPGYSVKKVKFYTDNTTAIKSATTSENATLIGAFNTGGKITVSFPTTDSSDPDWQKAHISLDNTGFTAETYREFGELTYGVAERNEKGDEYLKRSANDPSYANNGVYTTVLPVETASNTLELRIDYTLEAIDGSGEEITIHGAKAFVPTSYTQWLPNYAYTYIFKISDNTNGWANPDDEGDEDLSGLFPITFDAVVVDSQENTQSTITTVATPSITAYQNGRALNADEFGAGDIYVQVMKPAASGTDWVLANDLDANGQLYTVTPRSGKTITEADVMDALNIQASATTTAITGRNGWELTKAESVTNVTEIPRADGNNIEVTAKTAAKFEASAGTYAYVYTMSDAADTEHVTGFQLDTAPTNWSTTYTSYYTDITCTTAAPSTFVAGYYYQKYTNNNTVYGVKVIKVQ